MKYKITLFFLLISPAIPAQFDHLFNPYIINYTTKDYNGQPENFAAIEDNRGFLYFGNLWGILEFDGLNWRNIYFPNGSSGVSFAKDDKGQIYCGGRNEFGLLKKDQAGLLQYSSLVQLISDKVDFSDVWSTWFVDSSIVFCSYEALFIYKKGSITVIKPETTFERAFLVNGNLLVREEGRGLCRLVENQLELFNDGRFFAKIPITVILPYKEGEIIVAGNKDFYLCDGNSIIPWRIEATSFLKDTKLFTALLLNDSSFILATNTKGVAMMSSDGKILNVYNKNTGLISNDIINLFCDSNGNLWVLCREGISKVELNSSFSYINEYNGITGLNYSSCIFNQTLYLGTSNGLYYTSLYDKTHETNRNFRKIQSTDGNVWALQTFGENLFCGHNEGVFVVDGPKAYHIDGTTGVWCFIQPKGFHNILLAGTYQGIIVLEEKDRKWKMRGYVKGFYESSRFIVQDEMEDIWVSHGNKGIFKLSLTHTLDSVLKIKTYGSAEGIHSNFNNTVYKFNNQVIITNNQGFFNYNYSDDRFYPWNELNEAIGEFTAIQRFVIESDTSFWLILNDEKIIHLQKNGNAYTSDLSLRKFQKQLAGSFEHILPLDTNFTIIATNKGFALFNREKHNHTKAFQEKSFRTYIRKIELTRDSILTLAFGEKSQLIPEIKYKQNSIRFSFSSNTYEDIELTQFRFFLRGFDNTWSHWTSSSQKEYTNLPPGNYKFLVKALNSYGTISRDDSFEFIILPPWYQSNSAFLIYAFLVFITIFAIYKYIVYRFKTQKRRLELRKERELFYLNKQHNEEQIKKENKILTLTNEMLSAEIASLEQQELLRKKEEQLKLKQLQHEQEKNQLEITHKNKELSIMAMQIAHKNESFSKIREYLVSFNEKNNSPDFQTLTANLLEYLDKDILHDKEWKEFQEYFDMVHSSFIAKLKSDYPAISPALLKLCTYLRVKMSNKQIARLMNTTVESVLKSRYRLREKLQLSPDENLDDFIEKY